MNVSDTAAYAFLIFMVGQVWPTLAVAQDQLGHLFSDGAFSGQLRYRYEHVYQDGPPPCESRRQCIDAASQFRL